MMGSRLSQGVHRFELWLGFKEGVGKVNDAYVVMVQTFRKDMRVDQHINNQHQEGELL